MPILVVNQPVDSPTTNWNVVFKSYSAQTDVTLSVTHLGSAGEVVIMISGDTNTRSTLQAKQSVVLHTSHGITAAKAIGGPDVPLLIERF